VVDMRLKIKNKTGLTISIFLNSSQNNLMYLPPTKQPPNKQLHLFSKVHLDRMQQWHLYILH
jgi:hypothetical protein